MCTTDVPFQPLTLQTRQWDKGSGDYRVSGIVPPRWVNPKQWKYSTRAADLTDGEQLHVSSVWWLPAGALRGCRDAVLTSSCRKVLSPCFRSDQTNQTFQQQLCRKQNSWYFPANLTFQNFYNWNLAGVDGRPCSVRAAGLGSMEVTCCSQSSQ